MLPPSQVDPFAQFKATFFEECAELLSDMEQQLAELEAGEADNETLHAIFRAVHSIKAGAAAFSFERLVDFSHKFETLLDELREGRLEINDNLTQTLFRGFDVLSDLVGYAQNGEVPDPAYGQDALDAIERILEGQAEGAAPAAKAAEPEDFDDIFDGDDAGLFEENMPATTRNHFRIEFIPKKELYRNANEPLLIIRELAGLGDLKVDADMSRVPTVYTLEPEDAYLQWVFELETEYGRADIDEVFEFVVDDCDLTIVTLDEDKQVVDVEVSQSVSSPQKGKGFGLYVREDDLEKGIVSAEPEVVEKVPAPNQQAQAPVPAAAPVAAPAAKPSAPVGAKPASSKGPRVSSIRVDIDRVDKLVNMVGELVITQSMLAQEIEGAEQGTKVDSGMEEMSMHIRELQDNVMAIRMQPVKSVFQRMPRIVRDLSGKVGKKVKLVMEGESTEVDKTVIEELADPLTHMIRNSLDHGLETPEDRIKAGKPEEGVVKLSAEHRGGRIVIEIEDDGQGINRDRVLEKAVERGVVEADANLSPEDIDNLIFAPGFSTADAVTDLSGRGVGMDVVRRNIQSLGGRVSLFNEPGKGTRFMLTLPLTLAVLDGMIVGVGDQKYVIPINNIIETVRPPASDVNDVVGGGRVVRIRGEYIRLVSLADIFNVPAAERDPSKGLVVLVEADGGQVIGLVVDMLAGQQQVVIKSLESNYQAVEGISSATILGNGSVCLILDIDALARMEGNFEGSEDQSLGGLSNEQEINVDAGASA